MGFEDGFEGGLEGFGGKKGWRETESVGGGGVLVGDWQTGVEESAESVDGEEERAWHSISHSYRVVVVAVVVV